jgi:hypothetical protein
VEVTSVEKSLKATVEATSKSIEEAFIWRQPQSHPRMHWVSQWWIRRWRVDGEGDHHLEEPLWFLSGDDHLMGGCMFIIGVCLLNSTTFSAFKGWDQKQHSCCLKSSWNWTVRNCPTIVEGWEYQFRETRKCRRFVWESKLTIAEYL